MPPYIRRKNAFVFQDESITPDIRLGLCCINSELRKKDIFCSRTLIAKTYSLEKAKNLVLKNLTDLTTILEWNVEHNINHYRLSSDMFPRITDSSLPLSERVRVSDYKEILQTIGEFVKKSDQSITMHPGQYNQIGAIDKKVFEKTVEDLSVHSEILDYMGLDNSAILTIHGGGVYGDKENTIRRWIEQFDELPSQVKKRIAIENCERQYNVEDVLYIAEETKIPVIFDSHHFDCYNLIHNTNFVADDYLPYIIETWGFRRPIFHVSEQRPDARIGTHSDFIENLPEYFLNIPEKYGIGIAIEVEAKAKEAAIFKLYEKYKL
jgi:UV DNA damage endonuclease